MSEGVVPDSVTAFPNLGDDVRSLAHIPSNQKKRGLNAMPGENIEQMESVRIIRPVVESQRDLLRASLTAAKSGSKPLAGRGKRLISGSGGPDQGCTGDSQSKHAGIVNVSMIQ